MPSIDAIAVMRRLSVGRAVSLAALSAGGIAPRRLLPLLGRLRDEFGAVAEDSQGWRLCYRPQWLREEKLRQVLPARVHLAVASTNSTVRQYRPPFFLFTEHQTGGVGQRGKQWLALPGDALMLSALLPRPAYIGGLSVALGAALCRALGSRKRLQLKWPNDLLDEAGNKVAGLLVEIVGKQAIIGVGLNRHMTATLSHRIRELGGHSPAALNDVLPSPPSRHRCALLVAQTITETLHRYNDGGFPLFAKLAAQTHIADIGATLRFTDGRHAEFAGFDDDGALLTKTQGKLQRHIDNTISHVVSN